MWVLQHLLQSTKKYNPTRSNAKTKQTREGDAVLHMNVYGFFFVDVQLKSEVYIHLGWSH